MPYYKPNKMAIIRKREITSLIKMSRNFHAWLMEIENGTAVVGFPYSSICKDSACSAGDPGSIPGLGKSPGEGNGHPFQYACLENPMDRGAWQATVHGVARVRYDYVPKPPPKPQLLWKSFRVLEPSER